MLTRMIRLSQSGPLILSITLKHSFDVIDFRPYGGAILHILLSEITGHFLEDREEDACTPP